MRFYMTHAQRELANERALREFEADREWQAGEPDYGDSDDQPATMAEADREYARNVGAQRPQQAWVLSDRDVWYANPAYQGPAQPHPESDDFDDIPF